VTSPAPASTGARYRTDVDPLAALIVLGAVVLVAAAAGLALRAREGRVRATTRGDRATAQALDVDPAALGRHATLVQFSTQYCTRCPAARRALGGIAAQREGVAHVDIDLTRRPDLARRFAVLQTPTTLIVDASGTVRARIGGAPRPDHVTRELDRLLEDVHA
jgi:thiol-disulfide isomerase/thioredoxin